MTNVPVAAPPAAWSAPRQRRASEYRAAEHGVATPKLRLHHYFEASVDRAPGATAVHDAERQLTYRELDEHANRLAHLLRASDIGKGSRVGILLHRSWWTYAVLLGVLKAGAAFVPIDPASPPERVGFISENAGLDLLVSTTDLGAAATASGTSTLLLDAVRAELATFPQHRPAVEDEGDPVSYVIYTSGSSGRPKGVVVTQSSICNFIAVAANVYDVRPSDRVYQGMTISFDFSIEEIWPTLAVGATIVVGPTDSRRLGGELADFLEQTGVSMLYCVPTLLATIPRDLPGIRALLVGGEACPAGLVDRWSRPGRRMLNTYGPTEATVTATWGELLPGRPVTIGRPMPTYSIVLLDEDRRVVPDGAEGEICIGGPGVALGYVGLPEKTADRFIVHPAAPAGGRLYRTGDLGRIDEAGEVVYLGRADAEVKIRGHRVDLGEIENVLLENPRVESAVAALVPVGEGKELAAFVTCDVGPGDHTTDEDQLLALLHEQLRARLPDYMVPSYLDVLAELPMMPSGKVDRPRLPAPTGRRRVAGAGPVVPPATPVEEQVRAVWAEALAFDADQISVEADFFAELGGHSLAATTVVSLLRERGVGRSPAVRDLYANPTVRSLAKRLDSGAAPAAAASAAASRGTTRHSSALYTLGGSAQAAFIYVLLLFVTLPVAAIYSANDGQVSLEVLAELAFATTGAYLAMRWVLAPLTVRALGAGIAPGSYPLWSLVHLRLWASDLMLALSPLPVLSGSPILPAYLRLLGAGIGQGVHLGTSVISQPALLRIGDEASIGYGVSLRPWMVDGGWVVVEPITVADGAFVGTGAALEAGSTVGRRAVLAQQSTVVRGQRLPDGEHWAGSPSTPASRVDEDVARMAAAPAAERWTPAQHAGVLAGLLLLEALPLLMLVPSVLMVWSALLVLGEGPGLVAAVVVGPVFVLTVCVVVGIAHQAVLPTTPLGMYPARSALGIRKWMADKLLEMSLTFTNSLYSTLYTGPWLRMLGAKIGKGAEVSTVAHLDPDLLTLGSGSFVADMATVGGAVFHRGQVCFQQTRVGRRAFVGNAAMVPAGTAVGDGSLIGVQTVPPPGEVPAGTSWLGSPAMHLPARQDSGEFAERLTFQPGWWRLNERLAIEFFRITLPASLVSVAIYLYLLGLSVVARGSGWLATLTAGPVLALLTGLVLVLAVAGVKWVVVGTYRPRVEPLWSRFVRRTEFVTGLYEAAAVPGLLYLLVGTPFLPPMLRLLGAQVGRRTFIASTYLTEFDLVVIGDDAAIGRDVSLQTHLFEDRVMKMSTVRVDSGATVGDRSIVLYDATVGAEATLEPLSLAMKGEHLPARTRWRGIPAEGVV